MFHGGKGRGFRRLVRETYSPAAEYDAFIPGYICRRRDLGDCFRNQAEDGIGVVVYLRR